MLTRGWFGLSPGSGMLPPLDYLHLIAEQMAMQHLVEVNLLHIALPCEGGGMLVGNSTGRAMHAMCEGASRSGLKARVLARSGQDAPQGRGVLGGATSAAERRTFGWRRLERTSRLLPCQDLQITLATSRHPPSRQRPSVRRRNTGTSSLPSYPRRHDAACPDLGRVRACSIAVGTYDPHLTWRLADHGRPHQLWPHRHYRHVNACMEAARACREATGKALLRRSGHGVRSTSIKIEVAARRLTRVTPAGEPMP